MNDSMTAAAHPMTSASKLKLRILLPLALVLVAILGASVFSLYRQEDQYADEIFARDMQSVRNHYRRDMERRAEKMGSVLDPSCATSHCRQPCGRKTGMHCSRGPAPCSSS